jgi:hypothetical protein
MRYGVFTGRINDSLFTWFVAGFVIPPLIPSQTFGHLLSTLSSSCPFRREKTHLGKFVRRLSMSIVTLFERDN